MITHPAGEEVPVECRLCNGEGDEEDASVKCPQCGGDGTEMRALTEDLEMDPDVLMEGIEPRRP